MELRTNHRYPVGALLALAAVFAATPSFAMTTFDGHWSVNIASKTSACDVTYVVPIQVEDGNISYSGPFDATASVAKLDVMAGSVFVWPTTATL